jgi:hypothetical protein
MAHYIPGKRCSSCPKAVEYRTPHGKTVEWTDEQGRCAKCVKYDKPART